MLVAGPTVLVAFLTLLTGGVGWAAVVVALGGVVLTFTTRDQVRRAWWTGVLAGSASGVVFLILTLGWPLDPSATCNSGVSLNQRPGTSVAWLLPWAACGAMGLWAARIGQRRPDHGAALGVVARAMPAAGLLYLTTGLPLLGC